MKNCLAIVLGSLTLVYSLGTAQVPYLAANWIRAPGTEFGEWDFTEADPPVTEVTGKDYETMLETQQ